MADPTRGAYFGVGVRQLIDEVQKALALEGVGSEAQQRVVHRLVYGMPQGRLPIPMQRYTSVDLTIRAEQLRQEHLAQVPEGVRCGATDILGRLYAQAADDGDPFVYGRVLTWDLRLEPAGGSQAFGAYTMRATAEIECVRKQVTAAGMDHAIDGLLQQPRQREVGHDD